MERFSAQKVLDRMEAKQMSKADLAAAIIRLAPEDVRPTAAHIYGILSGRTERPGADYLTLFAQVLGCSRDDFFAVPGTGETVQ